MLGFLLIPVTSIVWAQEREDVQCLGSKEVREGIGFGDISAPKMVNFA